jgi:hypothetical protein
VVDVTSSTEERGGWDIEHVQERRDADRLTGSWRAGGGRLAAAAARAEGRLAKIVREIVFPAERVLNAG